MVEELIAQRGYYAVIEKLIIAIYNLGEISLADPGNSTKFRQFDTWARAVRSAVLKHYFEAPFASRLTELDRRIAKELNIKLD